MLDNLYTLDATEIIVRIDSDSAVYFNQNNEVSIDQLKNELRDKELECLFQKLNEEEHRIIVPLLNGQFEIVAKQHLSETYEAVINKKLKTCYREERKLPDTDYLKEIVTIRLIDVNERGRATDEFEELYKKVESLNIASIVNIDDQQQVWFKWIEAQNAIINSLQKPFKVKGHPVLREVKNEKKEVTRYTLKFDLANEVLPEYRQLELKLKELGISSTLDTEGSALLTRDQLQVFDAILQRDFQGKLEREPNIGAILNLRPLSLAQKIEKELTVPVSQNHNKNQVYVAGRANAIQSKKVRDYGFELKGYRGEFRVINHGNIVENEAINNKYKINFGRKYLKPDHIDELILPHPTDNTIYHSFNDYFQLQVFYGHLIHIYGKNNVKSSVYSVFEAIKPDETEFFIKDFSNEFWVDLKQKLYVHNLEETINQYNQSIYLDYITEEDLTKKINIIEGLEICDITYSPLRADFKFKVKTNVIAKKTEKELFLERLKLLRGAEFVVEVPKEGSKRKELLFLGKLDDKESNIQSLVLYVPNIFKDDKEKAKQILKFLNAEVRPTIREIKANLIGDATKINWLKNAVRKITTPNDTPNGKPANERLGDFMFDSSKATPIHDINKIALNSEYYWEVRKNELLKLNESQRKAVLASIHCSDLALLQGPPGTGKTTVIAEIIWQIISKEPKHKILLTSETNLAVDNALDRLLNTKGVNPVLARYTSLIKPLRFGRMRKMDEEGAKYSVDRIMKWLDETYENSQEIDPDTLDEKDDDFDEDVQKNSPDNNAVQDWMKRIASRAKNNEPKYAAALKDWALDLSFPKKEIKQMFKEKYFEHANVVGSTCSSSGSPRFMWDAANAFSEGSFDDLQKLNYQCQVAPFGREFSQNIHSVSIPSELKQEFLRLISVYYSESSLIKKILNKDSEVISDSDRVRLDELATITDVKIRNETDRDLLLSYRNLTDYGKEFIAPYVEPLFQFDTVIMDEASKATPPELILPLCFGKRSIIIGDHRQLPPMLNEKDFKEALIEADASDLAEEIDKDFTETSQFERLILNPKVSPTIISRCNIQYRMHPDINNVINQFYTNTEEGDTGLFPCQELIENADDPDLNNIFSRHHGFYYPNFIDANTHTIWVDVKSPEYREGTSVVNDGEAEAVRTVIELLKESEGYNEFQKHWDVIKDNFKRTQEKEIGLVSFYGAQKRLLKKKLSGVGVPLKINTVDRFQGMERNIIIVSTVRSDKQLLPAGKVRPNADSGFAKSPQRLNVALSRARRLLIVVGNKDFFTKVTDKQGRPLYKNSIQEIEKGGRIIDFETLKEQVKK